MTHTDAQLKRTLAKMLPEILSMRSKIIGYGELLCYTSNGQAVIDTELLHLCWLAEETLTPRQETEYVYLIDVSDINNPIRATWQQRTKALAKVKGIKIV